VHEGKSIRCSLQLSSKCPLPHIGVNATGTSGVAGRAPKTRESRRRRRQGGGVSGAVPLPRKFLNFSSQNGVIWCILGVLFLRFMCRMKKNKTLVEIFGGRQHRTTPAGQILGGRDPCNPCGVGAHATTFLEHAVTSRDLSSYWSTGTKTSVRCVYYLSSSTLSAPATGDQQYRQTGAFRSPSRSVDLRRRQTAVPV